LGSDARIAAGRGGDVGAEAGFGAPPL
jgi:hypothetical protein